MEGAQVHWQTGQEDKEGGGGEEGLGLGQPEPEGEVGGWTEAGREPNASRAGAETATPGGSRVRGGGVSSPLKALSAADSARQQFASVCEESGVTRLKAGEAGGDSSPDVTDGREGEMSGEELPAGVEGKGEVMRGIGEGGCGEKERAGTGRGSAGKLGCRASKGAGGAKSFSKMDDS